MGVWAGRVPRRLRPAGVGWVGADRRVRARFRDNRCGGSVQVGVPYWRWMMARRRKRGRRRRPSRSRIPTPGSQSPEARSTAAGSGGSVGGGQVGSGVRAPAQSSVFRDVDRPVRDGQGSVGDGRIESHVAKEVQPPSGVGAERVIEAVEERLRVLAALDGANRALREAVAFYRSEGATLKEIADLMGVSAQAVHKHWLPVSSRPGTET